MNTDLFAAVSVMNARAVLDAIPPACRRDVSPLRWSVDPGGHAVGEMPDLTPRVAARHFVPAASALGASECSLRFEVSVERAGRFTPWVGSAALGDARFATLPEACDGLACDVDVFSVDEPVRRVRLRVRVAARDLHATLDAPWLVTLSACDLERRAEAPFARRPGVLVDVPRLSQMEEEASIRARICSPTSVAMVLGYFGCQVTAAEVASDVFHAGLDRYGIWPAAIRAGAQRGIPGYLLRFPDWMSAAWCLERGMPIVASVRYARGQLTDAAIDETSGHLLVLTGYEGDDVLVNDPASPTAARVARRYRRNEFVRAWLERSGIGYVFFRTASTPE